MTYREVTIRICTDVPANGYKRGNRTRFNPPPREVLRAMQPGESIVVKSDSHRRAYYNAGVFLFGRSGYVVSRREKNGWRIGLSDPAHTKKQEPLK